MIYDLKSVPHTRYTNLPTWMLERHAQQFPIGSSQKLTLDDGSVHNVEIIDVSVERGYIRIRIKTDVRLS